MHLDDLSVVAQFQQVERHVPTRAHDPDRAVRRVVRREDHREHITGVEVGIGTQGHQENPGRIGDEVVLQQRVHAGVVVQDEYPMASRVPVERDRVATQFVECDVDTMTGEGIPHHRPCPAAALGVGEHSRVAGHVRERDAPDGAEMTVGERRHDVAGASVDNCHCESPDPRVVIGGVDRNQRRVRRDDPRPRL
jgi:hypothetical protein